MTVTLSLMPLYGEQAALLQAIYDAVPGYWALYELPGAPSQQAARDLAEALETPGRTILGIVRPALDTAGAPSAEIVGALDLRLHYPAEGTATIGLILVAEPVQRMGVGRAAWGLLEPWLAAQAGMTTARAVVEQSNNAAVLYFKALGFAMTGEATRHPVGDTLVRRLTMTKALQRHALPD